jgi:hypothetical protein
LIPGALLGALTAFALPRTGGAANQLLKGTVGPDYTITLHPATTTSPPGKIGRPEPCLVPNLVRKTLPVARRRLARTSCHLGRVTRVYSRRVAKGRVLSQRPRAGRRLGPGTLVNLVLSRGRRR